MSSSRNLATLKSRESITTSPILNWRFVANSSQYSMLSATEKVRQEINFFANKYSSSWTNEGPKRSVGTVERNQSHSVKIQVKKVR